MLWSLMESGNAPLLKTGAPFDSKSQTDFLYWTAAAWLSFCLHVNTVFPVEVQGGICLLMVAFQVCYCLIPNFITVLNVRFRHVLRTADEHMRFSFYHCNLVVSVRLSRHHNDVLCIA
uniref:Uncharacterized protein n=1 Tax=Kalanchoe fedtschenkoi TaxID=63787 RepID=A0A7N0U9B9_KALFE